TAYFLVSGCSFALGYTAQAVDVPMTSKGQSTIEYLYHVAGKAEVVNGELALLSPTGAAPGYAGDEIFVSLREYAKRVGSGRAVGDNKAFVVNLPHRKSFSPNAAFYTGPGAGM